MKHISKYIIALLTVVSFTATAQEKLDEYLSVAAKNNPGIKASFNAYMAALEKVPQVNSLPDPQVAFAYFIKPVETRVGPQQFKISATQMFPWFGSLKARENVAVQEAKVKYETFEQDRSRLFNEVRATYYNLYFNSQSLEITKENIELLHTLKSLTDIKVEAGKSSAVDVYRLEMELGDLENQLALLNDNRRVLEVMFNNQLNNQAFEPIEIPDSLELSPFGLSKEAIMDSILIRNPQLVSLSLKNDVLNYRKDVARKAGLPNISMGLDYTVIGKGPDNLAGTDAFMFPKIGLTIPLYRNKYKAMTNEILYQQESVNYQHDNQQNLLETLLEGGWRDYTDAERRIKLYESQSELAGKALKLLETDYSSGKQSFEELLRMERKLLKYQLEKEKAITDSQVAASFLTYLMGK